jgi:hypothetical protein
MSKMNRNEYGRCGDRVNRFTIGTLPDVLPIEVDVLGMRGILILMEEGMDREGSEGDWEMIGRVVAGG